MNPPTSLPLFPPGLFYCSSVCLGSKSVKYLRESPSTCPSYQENIKQELGAFTLLYPK